MAQKTLDDLLLDDWTFKSANTQEHIHGIHSYPARMIPQVAKKLIEKYSKPGDVILDPFCGSGGVLAEAKVSERYAIGLDINPLACFLAKVKTTPIDPRKLEHTLNELVRKLYNRENEEIELPRFFNIEYWFKEETIRELSIIKREIKEINEKDIRDFFLASFSKTVREVSLIKHNEYKLYRISKEKIGNYNPNTFKIFIENSISNIKRMEEFFKKSGSFPSLVLLANTKKIPLDNGSINLIVTSPPYGDSKTTVAYGQFSRYSSLWLGFDESLVRNVDNDGLGGKERNIKGFNSPTLEKTVNEVSKKNIKRAKILKSFFMDLGLCISEMERVLSKNGQACIVIGNRTVSRVKIPTDLIIAEIGKEEGLEHSNTFYRRIPTKCIPWDNAPENISGNKGETIARESIIILKKP